MEVYHFSNKPIEIVLYVLEECCISRAHIHPGIKISCEYMLVTLLLKNMQVVARKNEKWYKDSCKRIRGLTQMYENHISVMFLLPTAHENECISSFKKLAYVFTIRNVTFYSVRY